MDISDLKVSNNPDVTLVTYSLGSCIGLAVWDPEVRVGGMLHYMLPDSSISQEKAKANPAMFADTGIPALFKACYKLGAQKQRMIVKVAGGAQLMDESGFFNIGKRNYAALRKMFWRNKVMVAAEDIGGMVNRTIRLNIGTGELIMKVSGKGEGLL
ncbi:chemotaxis protein CheD [Desulfatibacillum alkenivorans DSM 16219]|uniref:Probable chemoreceptor glutamine deamidase CheD n=1 Tax=Desulfatibacillum alkenivorans DSM 16219 TaxID=1121393 RepID=A0A1M6Y6D3_9BACT|nr:chemotaxis protein CheD [Desulfatibacillum alkenivorans DSM 16219]